MKVRKILIAGNWKMNHTEQESQDFFRRFHVIPAPEAELLFCLPFTDLAVAQKAWTETDIAWGAQNVFPEDKGAFTGEISPLMLKEAGCRYVICGHSERRQILGESDEFVARKVKSTYLHGMIPILCVGETAEERSRGDTEKRLSEELDAVFTEMGADSLIEGVIAYEPIWAIGSGVTAKPEDAEKVALFIRQKVERQWGKNVAENVRILYGGSIKADNVSLFLQKENIDGVLIGGASLSPDEMTRIYKKACIKEEI